MSLPYRTSYTKKISAKQEKRLAALKIVRLSWWHLHELDGGDLLCHICHLPIKKFEDLASDHDEPGKMGGCRNDAPENLKPAHQWCNRDKGSQRNYNPRAKTVPRRVGRLMRKNELDFYLLSDECFCGKHKSKERPCCLECWISLPGQLMLDLSRTGADAPRIDEYVKLLSEVETFIFKKGLAS